jgi:2-keto-4-pentenoate hydratase/2-oxohepta-3-ene-1,7-dioic acid hydratase in catechol pathway
MKICRYKYNSEIRSGVVRGDSVFPVESFQNIAPDFDPDEQSAALKIDEVEILAPVEPSKIVCVGRNYADHARELGNEVPKEPLLFLKAPSSIVLDGEEIVLPVQSGQIEHEGELAIVIGRECKNLAETDDALAFVLGYICLNDVTARDLQRRDVQFTRAKSFDTFCPISPFIETDLDASDVRVTTRVNGVVKQDGRTSQMVFPVPFLIRYISNQMTLKAGDVIATGTPSGVSKLNEGDVCEVEIEGIGVLRNPVKILEKL